MRLVGTTKPTIIAIRERTHWNSPNLRPQDPVTLGLCSQIDLDAEVKKAAARLERERKEAGIVEPPKAGTLLPAEESDRRGAAGAGAGAADGHRACPRGARPSLCSRGGGGDARRRLRLRQAERPEAHRRHVGVAISPPVEGSLTCVRAIPDRIKAERLSSRHRRHSFIWRCRMSCDSMCSIWAWCWLRCSASPSRSPIIPTASSRLKSGAEAIASSSSSFGFSIADRLVALARVRLGNAPRDGDGQSL